MPTKKTKTTRSDRSALITYDDAAQLFKSANLPSSTRTVRRHIWANPEICPLDDQNYHTKRVRVNAVERLIKKLVADGKARNKSSDAINRAISITAPTDTAAARVAALKR